MQFEYDPERLIEEVKKRPGIWDFENVEYRTKNMRHKLWTEVVNELMQTNVKVSKSEMRELELQLQKKWKSIRDCFQKYVANPNRTKRPYIYSKQLQFLLKEQDLPQHDGSSESDDGQKIRNKIWRSKKKLKLVKDTDQTTDDEENDNFDNHDESRSNYSNEGVEINVPVKVPKGSKNVMDEFAFANVDAQPKGEAEDPDKMFLLSLLPHLKTIPEEFRLNVKMELMQVLQTANYSTVRDHKLI